MFSFFLFPPIFLRVFEERVDLSNDMTWRQMIAVGIRRLVLARGELDKLEGPGYSARRAELRREARARENDVAEEEVTRNRRTRVGRPRGGMKTAARIGEGLRREIDRGKLDRGKRQPVAAASRIRDVLPQGGCVPGSGDGYGGRIETGRGGRPRVGDG